jgi:hypothetical protein
MARSIHGMLMAALGALVNSQNQKISFPDEQDQFNPWGSLVGNKSGEQMNSRL